MEGVNHRVFQKKKAVFLFAKRVEDDNAEGHERATSGRTLPGGKKPVRAKFDTDSVQVSFTRYPPKGGRSRLLHSDLCITEEI